MPVIDQCARLLSQRTRKPAEIARILDEFFLARLQEIETQVDEIVSSDQPAADVAEVKARSGKTNMKVPKVK